MIKQFVGQPAVDRLASEMQSLFSKPLLNKRSRTSVWLVSGVKELAVPTALRSLNLLELCLDVRAALGDVISSEMIVTNLQVFSDVGVGDYFWHTDQRKGMLRALLYVQGGDEISGGFQYMRGTHAIEHTVSHELTPSEAEHLGGRIERCNGDPGDLVVFDPFGFHTKGVCTDERLTVMIEFQQPESPHDKASIDVNSLSLTERVVDNIRFFMPPPSTETYGSHGVDINVENDWFPAPVLRSILTDLIRLNVRRSASTLGRRLLPASIIEKLRRKQRTESAPGEF